MSAAPRSPVLRSPWLKWGLVALIQLALVALPLAERLRVHATGSEVTLALAPIDPRDLLRGDYVILNPQINVVEAGSLADSVYQGDPVWAVLEADGEGIHRAVALLDKAPGDGRLAIRGHVRGRRSERRLAVDYGLDAFFVPEGQGLDIERLPRDRVRLVVAVTADGRSAPLRLMADGKVLLQDSAF